MFNVRSWKYLSKILLYHFRVDVKDILHAASCLPNVEVGDFEQTKNLLKIGDLFGNRFNITLRDISCDPKIVQDSFESIVKNGFINYFGIQRFGSFENSTCFIGKYFD